MDNGYGTYGMPMEAYQDPYQAYVAYLVMPDQRLNQPPMFPPQAYGHHPVPAAQAAAARRMAEMQAEEARRRQNVEAALQLRYQEAAAIQAGLQPTNTEQEIPEGIARLLLQTPDHQAGAQPSGASVGSPSLNEAVTCPLAEAMRNLPDSVRRNLMDMASIGEAGNTSGANGTIGDLDLRKVMEARAQAESQSGSPKGHEESRVKTV
jgi:hypothetical protein